MSSLWSNHILLQGLDFPSCTRIICHLLGPDSLSSFVPQAKGGKSLALRPESSYEGSVGSQQEEMIALALKDWSDDSSL